jgi:maltodextrin utilization protein YvdJ
MKNLSKKTTVQLQNIQRIFIVFILSIFLVACTISPVHNDNFQKDAFSLSQNFDKFFVEKKSAIDKITYASVQGKYNEFEVDLNKLVMGARLIDSNESTAKIAELIRQDFRDMRSFHIKENKLNPGYFGSKQIAYEGLFYSLLKAEASKPK